jgi:hypothetical protein
VLGILKNGDTIGWQLWLSASKSLAWNQLQETINAIAWPFNRCIDDKWRVTIFFFFFFFFWPQDLPTVLRSD